MSPWHLKLVNQSRYLADGRFKYRMVDDDMTRLHAASADYFSFALTAIRILGRHCSRNDSLCLMARRIVSLQQNSFAWNEGGRYINWKIKNIENMLNPYWNRMHSIISHYIRNNRGNGPNADFIMRIIKWLRFV